MVPLIFLCVLVHLELKLIPCDTGRVVLLDSLDLVCEILRKLVAVSLTCVCIFYFFSVFIVLIIADYATKI